MSHVIINPANGSTEARLNTDLSQGVHTLRVAATLKDSAANDAFSRLRVSSPKLIFDSQLTYDLQPLLWEQITNGTGATIAHNTQNRCANLAFSSTPTGGNSFMQTYEHFRYQPGRGQLIFITFNFVEGLSNCIKFAGYSDGTNGLEFVLEDDVFKFRILSGTTEGNDVVTQTNWNIDKFDGFGPSGVTLQKDKVQILVIDFQALYVGRVRMGFDIDGVIYYAHEFRHVNNGDTSPYIQTANLPVRCGMSTTGTVTTTMQYICSAVISEGGEDEIQGFQFAQEAIVTAGSGVRTHALSIRPKTTFNSFSNRAKFILETVEILVTGNAPVVWELCIGQAISGTTTFNDVNTTYSTMQFNTAGTISGSPAIIVAQGYGAASSQSKSVQNTKVPMRYPITLDRAGNVRGLGTLSIVLTGVGASSATRIILNWKEIR